MSNNLKSALIRLAHSNPELRADILPLLTKEAKEFATPEALKEYLKEHPNADVSKHTVKKTEKPKATPQENKPVSKKNPTEALKGLFEDAERAMTPKGQPTKDPKKIFEAAKDAHQHQVGWLNQGKGLDKAIGADVYRCDKDNCSPDYNKPGPMIIIGPMKKQDRAEQKIKAEYGGDWSQLTDAVRASVAVDSLDQIEDVMAKLRKSGLKLAKPPKDRFSKPTDAGYRDLMLNVEYPNGHIGELQLHLKPVLKAKEKGHKYYEQQRSVGAKLEEEGRQEMTEEEHKQVTEAIAAMQALYNKAWDEAIGTASGSQKSASKTAAKIKYYLYNDQPAVWEGRKIPMLYINGKDQPMYELDKFFEQAEPVSKSQFDAAKDKKGKKEGSLRGDIIRLAHGNPTLRPHLLNLLK